MNKVLFPIDNNFEAFLCNLKDQSSCLLVLVPEEMSVDTKKLIQVFKKLCNLYPQEQILIIEDHSDPRKYIGHEKAAVELYELLAQVKILNHPHMKSQVEKCLLPTPRLLMKAVS